MPRQTEDFQHPQNFQAIMSELHGSEWHWQYPRNRLSLLYTAQTILEQLGFVTLDKTFIQNLDHYLLVSDARRHTVPATEFVAYTCVGAGHGQFLTEMRQLRTTCIMPTTSSAPLSTFSDRRHNILHPTNTVLVLQCCTMFIAEMTFQFNPFQPSDATWHHTFHLSLICMSFASWFQ
jgi:hypothetical protein